MALRAKESLMRKLLTLIIWAVVTAVSGYSELDYASYSSIEEVIEQETLQIHSTSAEDYETLGHAYASRGESYLIAEKYEEALADLLAGYKLVKFCGPEEGAAIAVRTLLDLAIVYGNLGQLDEVLLLADRLQGVSEICPHSWYYQLDDLPILQSSFDSRSRPEIQLVANTDRPIVGPKSISVHDCIEYTQGTARAARALIVKARPEVQFLLQVLIDDLENRAINCCHSGGVWKGCLQPLVNKWRQWNQKWQVFKIPPDPAWD